jgi:hypothetical protein
VVRPRTERAPDRQAGRNVPAILWTARETGSEADLPYQPDHAWERTTNGDMITIAPAIMDTFTLLRLE